MTWLSTSSHSSVDRTPARCLVGGYFVSLRARASSREPVCEPQKIPAKKSKNGHNVLIWHLLHAGYFIYANTQVAPKNRLATRGSSSQARTLVTIGVWEVMGSNPFGTHFLGPMLVLHYFHIYIPSCNFTITHLSLLLSLGVFLSLVSKLLFSGFLQFKGNFASDQNNSKCRD